MNPKEIQRLKDARDALTDRQLNAAAERLGVKPDALAAYGAGYDAATGCLTLPLYNGQRNTRGELVAFGIRLVNVDGTDAGMAGGVPGLLVPDDYDDRSKPVDDGAAAELGVDDPAATVYAVAGGAAECAALRSLGLLAVGRYPAGLAAAGEMLRRMLAGRPAVHVVAVAGPRDEPAVYPRGDGNPVFPMLESSLAVCDALEALQPEPVASLRFLMPPGPLMDWCRGKAKAGVDQEVTEAWLHASRGWLAARKAAHRKPPETD